MLYTREYIVFYTKEYMIFYTREYTIQESTLPFSPPPGSQMENENDYNLAKYKNFLRKFYDTINIKPILYIQL